MYRLLIVDDEPVIVDNFYDIFTEIQDLELDVYKAYSGVEALESMKKVRFDIVLTDICMPVLTGLDIQREINLQWPRCKVIFLTGHDDFEYVQSALRNNGADYILKTENEAVVLGAVRKAAAYIDEGLKNELLLQKAREDVGLALPLLQEKCLLDIAEGIGGDEEITSQFAEYGMPLNSTERALLMVGRVDACAGAGAAGKAATLYGIRRTIEEYLKQSSAVLSAVYDRTWLLWAIQPKPPGKGAACGGLAWDRTVLYVKGTMDSMQGICRQAHGVSISLAVAGEPVEWRGLPETFDSLRLVLNRGFGLNSGMLLIDGGADEAEGQARGGGGREADAAIRASVKKIGLLEGLLDSGQEEAFMEIYAEAMAAAGRSVSAFSDVRAEAFYSVSALILSCLNRWEYTGDVQVGEALKRLPGLEITSTWVEITAYFRSLAQYIFTRRKDDCYGSVNRIFSFIRSHAERHLDGDLSLARFAELLHFNPFYLSRLFRQETGKSFSEYIAEVKIAKAKDMLRQGDMKIGEITSALGFETSSYFARFFKKNAGLTPQEYRDSARR